MARKTFTITLDMPEGADAEYMEEYIERAVCVHRGGMSPEEPVYTWDNSRTTVRAKKLPQLAIQPGPVLGGTWPEGDDSRLVLMNYGKSSPVVGWYIAYFMTGCWWGSDDETIIKPENVLCWLRLSDLEDRARQELGLKE